MSADKVEEEVTPQALSDSAPSAGPTDTLALRRQELVCIVCFSHYDLAMRLPRQLHCGHTFCQACLKRLDTVINEQVWIPCPQCRQNTPCPRGGAAGLDLDLATFLGVKAQQPCDPPWICGVKEGPLTAQDTKLWLGKEADDGWSHGGLAEPRFHRYRNCCPPASSWLCCWLCCQGRG